MSDVVAGDGKDFAFAQAVFLVEAESGRRDVIGQLGPVADEPIRFRGQLGLGFPASELDGARWVTPPDENSDRKPVVELVVNFLTLYGSASPLPADLTERLIRLDDTGTARDFLDIFNHRLISLCYRTWRKYRFELERVPELTDVFSTAVQALAGLGDNVAYAGIDRAALLGRFRDLVPWTRSAANLVHVLHWYFPAATWRLFEFEVHQIIITPDDQWRMGHGALGTDVVLGNRMTDVAGRIRIVGRAEDWPSYRRFLPDGEHFATLTRLVRLLLRDPLEVLFVPMLDPDSCQPATVGSSEIQLGFNTWLGAPSEDPDYWAGFLLPDQDDPLEAGP